MQAGVAQLGDVVGRNVGGHADRDSTGSVGQQIRELRGQHDGFGQRAIVVVAKIDGVLCQPVQQCLGHSRHAGFGIAGRGGVIAVDIAKVALPVHQRIADVEILRQTGHRVVNRGIPMRVIIAHYVAGNLGRLAESAGRGQAQLAHRIENSAMHGFQTVARIRQGAVHDRGQRIGQIPIAERAAQRLG